MTFPVDYSKILERIAAVKPVNYARTRNFTDGDVTYLSPYIARGVISLRMVAAEALAKHSPGQIEKFLQELAWREYWQRVWQHLGDKIFTDIKQPQAGISHHQMATAINTAATGITAVDKHIQLLYQTGYLHNHLRMYISSIACNIAKAHWLQPSRWMYYHLLDGDLASNSLSWQWVAGSFSSKKYYCNQDNINRYTHSEQQHSFLDCSYDELVNLPVPEVLQATENFSPTTVLPATPPPVINPQKPLLIYNSYNLDPLWHGGEVVNRILLLEPSHFERFPVSEKVLQFILGLSKNIPGIQLLTGEYSQLEALAGNTKIIHKSHPAFTHYKGGAEKQDELFPGVTGYFPSFFSYWKKCEKQLDGLLVK